MYDKKYFPKKRYKHTLQFFKKYIPKSESILDLGEANPFSKIMQDNSYSVENTKGEDLDYDTSTIEKSNLDIVIAFVINSIKRIELKPFLRLFTPKYYIVYAERI